MPLTVIQCSIYFVHDKERSWMVGMNREQKSQRCHRLLSATELIHVSESFHRRHGIELHTTFEWLLIVIESKICVTTQRMFARLCHIRVDRLQSLINVVERVKELLGALFLDFQKLSSSLTRFLLCLLIIGIRSLEFFRDCRKCLVGLNEREKKTKLVN